MPVEISRLKGLLDNADFFNLQSSPSNDKCADCMYYTITYVNGDRKHTYTGSPFISEALRPFLAELQKCITDNEKSCVKVPPPIINSFTFECEQAGSTAGKSSACTLMWNVTGPAGVDIQPGIGHVGLSGSVKAQRGITYTLTASGIGGSVKRTLQVQ